MTDTSSSTEPTPLIAIFRRFLDRAEKLSKAPKLSRGGLAIWASGVRSQFEKIYGKDSSALEYFSRIPLEISTENMQEEFGRQVAHLKRFVNSLETLPYVTNTQIGGSRIFIGHGRSPLWRELKDFLSDRLNLPWDEFNRESVAGVTTAERLEWMMSEAAFAFLIMTAEEEHSDARLYARPNVIHEVGLFQGRLGVRRAIVLLEEGCSEFSNIVGLSQIRFPRGDIAARFEEIRRVLEREGVI